MKVLFKGNVFPLNKNTSLNKVDAERDRATPAYDEEDSLKVLFKGNAFPLNKNTSFH